MEITAFLNSQNFIKTIQESGEVYIVGGIVRDHFLQKKSKDIDLIVTGIPIDDLIGILELFGQVDFVGKSFGVLKFRPKGFTKDQEDIDIAIPRTERKIGVGHQGFEINADHTLTIEEDLIRRDFTLNAMAVRIRDGELIDPFNGMDSIKNKEIRIVNPIAFSEDPLRMLRAIQFSSRFGFKIEPATFHLIRRNASMIKEIAGERILTELDKIFSKGDHEEGFIGLKESGLFIQIFGFNPENRAWFQMKNRFDFFFHLLKGSDSISSDFGKILKGDTDTIKILEALEMMNAVREKNLEDWEKRLLLFHIWKKSTESFSTEIAPVSLRENIQELLDGKFIKSTKELEVDGNDLMEIGFKGKQIGDTIEKIVTLIMKEELLNERESLLALLKFEMECSKALES